MFRKPVRSLLAMARPQNLLTLAKTEFMKFFNSFDTVLSDCDGVIHVGYKAIGNATSAIRKLRDLDKKVHYVSNNCTLSLNDFAESLRRCGVPEVDADDVVIPTVAIIDYLKAIGFNRKVYLIGLNNMKGEFRAAGLRIADYGPDSIEEKVDLFIEELRDDVEIGAVVVDVDINMTYLRLQRALVYLGRTDVIFITAGSDRRIPFEGNITLIGPAYFQTALIDLSGREPLQFGKPGVPLNEYLLAKYNLVPERTLFVGDSFSDMEFAEDGGYQKLLVLTGNVTKEDFERTTTDKNISKYYLEKFEDLCTVLDRMNL